MTEDTIQTIQPLTWTGKNRFQGTIEPGAHYLVDTPQVPKMTSFSPNVQPFVSTRKSALKTKTSPRLYSDEQTILFRYLLDHFLIEKGRFEQIVNYILAHDIEPTTFQEYADAAQAILSRHEIRIDLKYDTEDDISILYMTFILFTEVSAAIANFDTFIDNFLIDREPDRDKIEVNLEVK